MKKLPVTRSLLFALLLISVQGFSQNEILGGNQSTKSKLNFDSPSTYVPFISESKEWKCVLKVYLTSGSDGAYYLVNQSYFKGDTIVDNIKYNKLYDKYNQPIPEKKANLAYLMREDTVDQKVYVFDPSSNKHALLYDFKLNKGDEFNLSIWSDNYPKHTVVKVDTITLANKKLKRIEFNDSIIWIEGIGSITSGYILSEGELICMRENEDLWYLNPRFNNCDTVFTQGWDNIQTIKSDQVKVFPNPVVSTSVVRVELNNHDAMKIEIYSYSGALVKEDYFSGDYPIGSLQLAKGMYVYRITLGNKVIQMDKIMVVSQ